MPQAYQFVCSDRCKASARTPRSLENAALAPHHGQVVPLAVGHVPGAGQQPAASAAAGRADRPSEIIDSTAACGCKGIRTCLLCEGQRRTAAPTPPNTASAATPPAPPPAPMPMHFHCRRRCAASIRASVCASFVFVRTSSHICIFVAHLSPAPALPRGSNDTVCAVVHTALGRQASACGIR